MSEAKNDLNYFNVLRDIEKIFRDLNIPIWLEDGTLLGAYRDRKMISGDERDIDFGILKSSIKKKNTRKKLSAALEKKRLFAAFFWDVININKNGIGIDIVLIDDTCNNKFALKIRERSDGEKSREFLRWANKLASVEYYGPLKIDGGGDWPKKIKIFKTATILPMFFRRLFYKFCNIIFPKSKKPVIFTLKIPLRHFRRLDKIKYYDLTFNIPFDAEEYLKLTYGEWNIPLKKGENFDWREHGNWIRQI
jgi:phosphorylcholine metabolism protein LicD